VSRMTPRSSTRRPISTRSIRGPGGPANAGRRARPPFSRSLGVGGLVFFGAWEKKIGPALAAFRPELLLVSAGFDAHEDDPLGGLEVTTEGYRELAQLIKGWAVEHCRGRTVWALEGGYNLRALGDSVVSCLEVLLDETTDGDQRVDTAGDRGYNSGSPD